MGIFTRSRTSASVTCPACGGNDLGLGYVDRVACTVLHTCHSCGERWRDHLIDLATSELAQRASR